LSLLTDAPRAEAMRAALSEIRGKLGRPGASGRAAEAVLDVARSRVATM
jgi:hypothetical protein